jgi:hypothetical protein
MLSKNNGTIFEKDCQKKMYRFLAKNVKPGSGTIIPDPDPQHWCNPPSNSESTKTTGSTKKTFPIHTMQALSKRSLSYTHIGKQEVQRRPFLYSLWKQEVQRRPFLYTLWKQEVQRIFHILPRKTGSSKNLPYTPYENKKYKECLSCTPTYENRKYKRTGLVAQSVMSATDMSEFRMVSMVIGPQNSVQT